MVSRKGMGRDSKKTVDLVVVLLFGGLLVAGIALWTLAYGPRSKVYTDSMTVGNESAAVLTPLKKGTKYYIVAVAIDDKGNQSPPSNEIEVITSD